MKKLLCILCVSIMLFLLCSCKADTTKLNEYEPAKTTVSKESVKEFMSLLKELAPSGEFVGYEYDESKCYNVTPTQVAEETDMKIFKFSDSCVSFVMVDNEVYYLYDTLGRYGFVNAIPCDFDNDGNKDLLIASSGGGLKKHFSTISVFNSVSKERTVLYDTSTTDKPKMDLIVAQSTANVFTDEPKADEGLYYSVLSAKIDFEDNNFAQLSYEVDGVVGHIEVEDDTPTFVPYKNNKKA